MSGGGRAPRAAAPPDLYGADRVAPLVDDLGRVGDGDLEFFREHGYLAILRAVDADRVAAAARAVDALIDGRQPDYRGVQFEQGLGGGDGLSPEERRLGVRKLMGFVDWDEDLGALSREPGLLALVGRLLGDEPELFQDMALLKPPGGREKPWHQDMAYFNVPVDAAVVGVWIALDEATAANGAMRVIPGSHRQGPQLHFNRRDWQVCDTEVDRGRQVVVPLPPGGALLWHGLTLHGSPPNHSAARRRALQFHYRPAAIALTTTEARMQVYGGEVRGAEC